MKNAHYWIRTLELTEHPEGGYFRETYRSQEQIGKDALPPRFSGPRTVSTAIYFLLKGGQISRWHRIKSDEIWHFYAGAPLTLHIIEPAGQHEQIRLGPDENGGVFQAVVRNGCWFGAISDIPDSYSLVGCTVAPGFDFADFEMGNRDELLAQYPQHTSVIKKLSIEN
jgi:predicted cupin superfamily sugar epimerase